MYETAYKLLGGDTQKMVYLDSAIKVIRNGITIKKFDQAVKILEVSRKDFARMIGLNIRTLHQKKPGDHITSQQSEHVLAILQVMAIGIEYFGDKNTTLVWLYTPNLGLGKNEPFSLMDTIAGIKIVRDTINRLKYGMTA